MLRDAAFGLWSRSCVGPGDGGFIRILRVGNCTQFRFNRLSSSLMQRSMTIAGTLRAI